MHGLGDNGPLGHWTRIALNLFALTVVASLLASAAVALLAKPTLPLPGESVMKAAKDDAAVSISPYGHFAPIWLRNAFKAALPKPPPPPKPPSLDQLPVAKLNVSLLGTMYSEVSVLSRAVVLEGNRQSLVKVGDKLSGFDIAEIQRRAIVLQRGKQRQLLLIDAADKKSVGKQSEERKMFSRDMIKDKLKDLDALARDIQLSVATRGKQQGLWVRQLRAGSLFSKAGLRKDDVILTVGGQPVAKGANPVALIKLLEQSEVVVDILRDGKQMQLVLLLTG
jgi:type II secretion system protein C